MSRIQQVASLFFLLLFCFSGYAQNELNPFKYIIVPKQYDFLKKENQYRVNSMTKYLFEQEGFTTLYQGDEYPADLNANPCLALTAIVLNESSAFTTKLRIALKDCRDQEVYTSAEGKSKIKEFDKTYIDALKKSFVSIQSLDYSYDESLVINSGAIGLVANNQKIVSSEKPAVLMEKAEPVTKTSSEPVSVAKNTSEVNPASVAVIPVAAADQTKSKESAPAEKEPVVEASVAEAAVETPKEASVAVAVAEPKVEEATTAAPTEKVMPSEEKSESPQLAGGARAFKNDTTTFLLVDQGAQMQAFVSESKNKNYKPGELIGTFKKTSLPNVFRVSWKKPQKDIDNTTAYFDEQGNLKIDILRNDKIEVLTFTEVK